MTEASGPILSRTRFSALPRSACVRGAQALILAALLIVLLGPGCRNGNLPANEPTITRIWWTPAHPSPGQPVVLHARIRNHGNQPIPAGSQFCVAFAIDGQRLGAVQYETPYVSPTGLVDVSTQAGNTDYLLPWRATAGSHFVIAALARSNQTFDDNDVFPETASSALMQIDPPGDDLQIRIMALGDSITGGSHSSTSYRYYLSKQLKEAGYDKVTFVGSLKGITDGFAPPDTNWEMNHEGHPGWRADQIEMGTGFRRDWAAGKLGGPAGWARVYRPDIVLIDLGLNDLSQGRSPRQAVESIGQAIDTLRRANPTVAVALAEVTPEWTQEPGYNLIGDLNEEIRIMALRKTRLTSPVMVVDLNSGIDVDHDLVDGVHPNDDGHKIIASRWLPVVERLIGFVAAQRAGGGRLRSEQASTDSAAESTPAER